jgi:hypothetical protein
MESSQRENGSRHSAGSSGGMLADGAFISETGRVGTDKTDRKDFVGFVS